MKRTMKMVLVVIFFAFVAAALASYACLICYPDHPYFASVQKAVLAATEGGQDNEAITLAWAQGESL